MFGIGKIGKFFGAGDAESSNQEELKKAQALWDKLNTPSYKDLTGGDVKSSYAKEDPRLKRAQMDAIMQMQDLYKNGGVDARATADLDTIRRGEDQRLKGNLGAIRQNQYSRGISGGSPIEQMLNAQNSADRQSGNDLQVYGQNEARAIDALKGSASLSGDVRGQDFQRMSALDRIKEFNNRNRADARQQEFTNRYGVTGKKSDLYKDFGTSKRDQGNSNFDFGAGILKSGARLLSKAPWGKIGKGIANTVGAASSWDGNAGSENDPTVYTDDTLPTPDQSYDGGGWQSLNKKSTSPKFRKYT